MPIFYECDRCTACCRWPGQVRLNDGEIARLAAFKGVTEREFIERFTRLTDDRRGLALLDKPNGECVFLDGRDCSVQPVKPQQCRDFPNLWNFPGFEQHCRAIPRRVSAEEYERLVLAATGRRLNTTGVETTAAQFDEAATESTPSPPSDGEEGWGEEAHAHH